MSIEHLPSKFLCLTSERDCTGKMRTYEVLECSCGTIYRSLPSNKARSCGCFAVKIRQATGYKYIGNRHAVTHGMSNTPTYTTWRAMLRRCHDTSASNFYHYGGKGITVCDRWRESFESFLIDMGERPSTAYSIDRIDSAKGYYKENCRWVTKSENSKEARRREKNARSEINEHGKNECVTPCG